MSENSVVLRATPIDKLRNIINLEKGESEFTKAVSFSEFYSLLSIYCRKRCNIKT